MMKPDKWMLAGLIVLVGALLSWPFWVDHQYWAESRTMWYLHVVLACGLGLYVAAMFVRSLATLIRSEAVCCKPREQRRQPNAED